MCFLLKNPQRTPVRLRFFLSPALRISSFFRGSFPLVETIQSHQGGLDGRSLAGLSSGNPLALDLNGLYTAVPAINHARAAGVAQLIVGERIQTMDRDETDHNIRLLQKLTNALSLKGETFSWQVACAQDEEHPYCIFVLTYKAPR